MELSVVQEPGRFVVRMGNAEAHLTYERHPGVLEVISTFTPPALRGRGIAARLTETVIAFARQEGLRIRPTCSYTRAYLEDHPAEQDLWDEE